MTDRTGSRLFALVSAAVLLAFGALLFVRTSRAVGGSDSAGYANTGKDILAGQMVNPIAGLKELGLDAKWAPVFTPLAHEPGPRPGTMVPFYPPGFPLHLALAAAIGGWGEAPYLVSPIAGLLCLCATFLLGRELGLSRPFAFAGSAILGGWVIFLFHALQPMSDVAAALWTTASVVAALRARRRTGWAAAAGACLGMAVLVRPSDALMLVPLALALPWRLDAFAWFGAGGAPFAAFYGLWNRTAFGNPLRNGYTHVYGDFVLSNFAPRFVRYGSELLSELSFLVPLGGIAVAADRRVAARDRLLLLVWLAAIFLFYCFWGPSDSWTYGRYLLPAAPALIVGFLLVLRDAIASLRRPALRHALVAAALVVVFAAEIRAERLRRPLGVATGQRVFPEGCRALAERAAGRPALAVSMEFSAAVRFYGGAIPVRWDFLNPEDFLALRVRAADRGYRILAVLQPHEVPLAIEHVPGPWVFLQNAGKAGIWELPPGP